MEKYLKKINAKHYVWISFILTCIAMYVMFSYEEILSTGRYVILEGDLLEQIVPFTKMFVRDVLRGEDLSFSWSLSMGMNTSLCYAYYVLNPFNILYLIFYSVDEAIVTAAIIILKTGLAAAMFHKFSEKVLGCKGIETVVFSIFYAFCSFNLLCNVLVITWMDAMYMLPILCILLSRLVNEGKWKGLVPAFAYMFIIQFYMAYIVGVFAVIYFCAVLIIKEKKQIAEVVKMFSKFVGSVLLAVGIATAVWLPALIFLLENRDSTQVVQTLSYDVTAIIRNLFWGQVQGTADNYPYIYCGIPVIILVPYFFFNKDIKRKIKIVTGGVFVLFLVAMLVKPIYSFWHAFDMPDSYGYRFSFIVSFVLCTLSCYQSRYIKRMKVSRMLLVCSVGLLFYVSSCLIQMNDSAEEYIIDAIWKLAVNIIIILIWIMLAKYSVKKEDKKETMVVVILFVVVIEVISNGYVTYQFEGAVTTERHYEIYKKSLEEAISIIDEDNEFYRVIYYNDYIENSDAWFGYKGITDFNSAVNKKYQNTMRQLGFASSGNDTWTMGLTPLSEMIFGVKYRIEGVHPYILAITVPSPKVNTNDRALSLGFATDADILLYQFEEGNPLDDWNRLLSSMTGETIECFSTVTEVTIREDNAFLYETDIGTNVRREEENEEIGYITYHIPNNGEEKAYAYFATDKAYCFRESPVFLYGWENSVYDKGHLTNPYIKEMTTNGDTFEVTIRLLPDTSQNVVYRQAHFCYYCDIELQKAYDILSQNQMVIREYGNTYIDAYVTVPKERTVLFTSIPYDEGWTVYVDGVETQTHAVVGDAFLALELEPGYHDLEFEYEAPGARMGMTVSGVSVGLYAGCILIEYMIKRKRKAKEGKIEPDVEDRTE